MSTIRKIVASAGYAWLFFGITILGLCVLEGALSLAFFVDDLIYPPARDQAPTADAYGNAPWVPDYYEEFRQSNAMQWTPYVYWRRRPYKGRYINIDNEGIRATKSPGSSSPSMTIFMFGGSTLWGTGARDEFTIPSILASELGQKGVSAAVTNFGESGYVTTQEVITLQLQLQRGRRPDLVIFYDGINDTFSAFQQHAAGLPQNEFNRAGEFNPSDKDKMTDLLRNFAGRRSTTRFLRHFVPAANIVRDVSAESATSTPVRRVSETHAEARQVIDTYASNIEQVTALSKHYGFSCLFYWQATIFQKPNLTAYEKRQRDGARAFEPVFHEAYASIQQDRLVSDGRYAFHDLSGVFSDVSAPLYVDAFHVSESGNAIVAKRMAQDVIAELAAIPDKRHNGPGLIAASR